MVRRGGTDVEPRLLDGRGGMSAVIVAGILAMLAPAVVMVTAARALRGQK